DEGMQGEVVDDKKEVVVQWPTQSVAFSRIGEDGLELLKCVIPANGVKYYKSHLPIL
ncbi:E3 ubiquitin-protein ligase MIB2, partial [Biomphalaria glabrata]